MAIALIGDADDLSSTYVGWLAEQRGVEVLTLREDRFGFDWTFEAGASEPACIATRGGREPLDPTGIFVRLNPDPAVEPALGLDPPSAAVYQHERRAAIHFLLESIDCRVVNRPSGGRSNASKPLQMGRLQAAGFLVPDWIAANDAGATDRFAARTGETVVKSCSGLRSHVRRRDSSTAEQIRRGTAPLLTQKMIAGFDARVHVIGSAVYTTAVRADAVDYRFDGGGAAFSAIDAPPSLAARCVAFAAAEGLLLAGFDFRVDRRGTWWCLEMNPVPTFLPYEAGSGHPIGHAIVNLLAPETFSACSISALTPRFGGGVEPTPLPCEPLVDQRRMT